MKTLRLFDTALLVVAVAAVVIASLSYARLRPTRSAPSAAAAPHSDSGLVGRRLPPISVFGETGNPSAFDPGTLRSTLVLVFTSTCMYCEMNAPSWAALIARLPSEVEVVAVNPEAPEIAKRWLTRHGLSVARVLVPTHVEEVRAGWGLDAVPVTMVLGTDGAVSYAHVGTLAASDLRELEHALSGQAGPDS